MGKYIDADKAIKNYAHYGISHYYDATDLEDILNECPAADVEEVVRCRDCKRSRQYEDKDGEIRVYCHRLEGYVESDDFCKHGIHIEKDKCYECPIAEQYNLEDDDTPCQNCGEDDAP